MLFVLFRLITENFKARLTGKHLVVLIEKDSVLIEKKRWAWVG